MEIKICKKCGKELSIDNFYKDRTTKDGFGFYCKACIKSYKASKKADTGGGNIQKYTRTQNWQNSNQGSL